MSFGVTSEANATWLPSTCGEKTDISGVPRVGCVAVVNYRAHTARGFAACVIGTADGVSLLGPDLSQRRRGHRQLITRRLWHPSTPFERGAGVQPASTEESAGAPGSHTAPAASFTGRDGSGVILAVTAFLLDHEPTASPLSCEPATKQDDTVVIVVAWSNPIVQRHHVTVLTVPLCAALTPSVHAEAPLATRVRLHRPSVHVVALDAVSLPPGHCVLRLFHHPVMAARNATASVDIPTSSNDGTTALAVVRHVVMCSLYISPAASMALVGHRHAGEMEAGLASPSANSAGAIGRKPVTTMRSTTGASAKGGVEGTSTHRGSGGISMASRRGGKLLFLSLLVEPHRNDVDLSAVGDEHINANTHHAVSDRRVHAQPSEQHHIAVWLRSFTQEGVLCAFAVQSSETNVTAAVGMTDGRVYVLRSASSRLVRRVSGPVADLLFVCTKPVEGDPKFRNAVVNGLLQDAATEEPLQNNSFSGPTYEGGASRDGVDSAALVVLDSAGHLLVMRGISGDAIITQSVRDVQQVITLSDVQQQQTHSCSLTPPTPSLVNKRSFNSKIFCDLSTLLQRFLRRRHTPLPSSQLPPLPSNTSFPATHRNTSGLTATPVNQSFALSTTGTEETAAAGHILSRGLLCVTSIDDGLGGVELVVSTMGQVVVSVPYNAVRDSFRIADFMVTPVPMFFVGFVDFFADRSVALVMAGQQNVLVACRSCSTLSDRARVLLRLLGSGGRHTAPYVGEAKSLTEKA